MKNEALKRIFEFLEDKEEHKAPFIWKLENNIPLTEEELNVKGNLNLHSFKKLTSLPKGLKVGGNLYIYNTPLTKYSDNELREMVKLGFIKGEIHR